MQILMDQWQYEASIYCPQARCWVLLKKAGPDLESVVASVNSELQKEYFVFKRGGCRLLEVESVGKISRPRW